MNPRLISFLNRPVSRRLWLLIGIAFTFLCVAPHAGQPPRDYDSYLEYSGTLLTKGTFGDPPDYWITPGYPAVLAFFRLVLPDDFLIFNNVFLFALSSFLFLKILESIGVTLRAWSAALSFFLWFANPFFIFLQTKLLSENAFIPAMMAFAFAFMRYLHAGKLRHAVAAFGLLGLSVYVRPVSFYLIWACALPMLRFRKPFAHYAVGVAAFFAVLLPWGLRNHFVLGDFHMTASHVVSESLLGSNNEFLLRERPDLRGNWMGIADTIKLSSNESLKEKLRHWMELHDSYRYEEMEAYSKTLVVNFWKDHWAELPGFVLDKLKWFWHYSGRHPLNRTWYYDAVGIVWYLIWLPLAAVFVIRRPRCGITTVFLATALYLSAVAAVTFGSARMRMPIEFFLIAMEIGAVPLLIPALKTGKS